MPRPSMLVLAAAFAALPIAARADEPATPQAVAALPAGEKLVANGLSGDGSRLATMATAPDGCWRLRLYDVEGGKPQPRTDLLARKTDAVGCVPTVAAMSSDGGTIAIQAYGQAQGRVYRIGTDGITPAGDLRIDGKKGYDHPAPPGIALSPDGRAVVVGARNYDCRLGFPADRCGSASLFQQQGSDWKLTGVFAEPAPAVLNLAFGGTVAVTDGAGVVVAGGQGQTGDMGQLLVFTAQPDGWGLASTLAPADASEGTFGEALAMTPNASLMAIGSDQSVYVLAKQGNDWKRVARITPPEDSAGGFGEAVALSIDGRRLLIGSPRGACASLAPRCGVAYLYTGSAGGSSWQLKARLLADTPTPQTDFGYAVALDASGRLAAVQGDRLYLFQP